MIVYDNFDGYCCSHLHVKHPQDETSERKMIMMILIKVSNDNDHNHDNEDGCDDNYHMIK